MSQRNGEGQGGARARLRAQQRRDRARAKRRRVLLVAVAAVAVLGAAAGIGVLVSHRGRGGGTGPVVAPAGATGPDKLVIPVGRAGAPATLSVYEDFRCPACKQFEDTFRGTIHDLTGKGTMKAEYRLVTIIDGNLGGSGSLNAANAAACAQDLGGFPAYHDVLYTHQPIETDDAYADKDTLIKLAGTVGGLDTPAFRRCVREGVHNGWVRKSTKDFSNSGFNATPTVLLNGKNVYADTKHPLTPQRLRSLVEQAAKG
ncbi:DsbA family protein [Streptomyces palmae]|uniref:Thioredoxin-like fold domain-containing protein n=1 Tax=Streptomyces palmae TaxID=1701085 RepID=A0A4Z0HDA4_9ACTN|nr:thioredoxin domain-containing protein [Streptomyces palmae]TGB14765.1 hypothetical protein E4099_07855 [Streptomyces palmae]